jgi:putative Mg2+ transporter-C (MgtC) family protein
MPLHPDLLDIALRILLTLVAGAAIGFERREHGKAAGLRTILLVALAACLAMVQLNLLLPIEGKTASSFAVMDVMRLPLGILSGVGFIGAGAILRRDNMVLGVTTAATLWYVTVLGLCFGGGQIWLGLGGLVLGVLIIQTLRIVEPRLRRDREATLVVLWNRQKLDRETLQAMALKPPFSPSHLAVRIDNAGQIGELRLQVRWRTLDRDHHVPAAVDELARTDGVISVDWQAGGMAGGE